METSKNVFIEEFTSKLDRHAVRTAPLEDIATVVSDCDTLANEIIKENGPAIESFLYTWLIDQSTEFGEWLQGHIPGAPVSFVMGKFSNDSTIISNYSLNILNEADEELLAAIDDSDVDCEAIPDDIMENIGSIVETIIAVEGAKAIKISGVNGYELEMFVPYVVTSDNEERDGTDYALDVVTSALRKALVLAALDGAACISTMVTDLDGNHSVCAMGCVDGSFYQISEKTLTKLIETIHDKSSSENHVIALESAAETTFDGLADQLSECILWCVSGALDEATFESLRSGRDNARLGISCLPQAYVSGEGNEVCYIDSFNPDASLSAVHSVAYDTTRNSRYASSLVQACAVTRAACSDLFDGKHDGMTDEIQDFLSYVELSDSDDGRFDSDMFAVISDHDDQISEKNISKIYREMFDDMPSKDKMEVNSVVDALEKCGDKNRMILSLDENSTGENGTGVKSYMLSAPGCLNDSDTCEKVRENIETLCARSYLGEYTMIIAMQSASLNDAGVPAIEVSGIKWTRAGWHDLGEEKTFDILGTTSAGYEIGLDIEYDDIKYVTLHRPK